ncbi:MAG: leucine-rich repeat domain-containing protein [Alistipes sp.]|nr:leucine-rich repeat domain-containing protein [Alistipes sp.]
MKKLLFISLFAALLLAGCKKEKIYEGDDFPPTEQVPGDDDGDNQDDEGDEDDNNNGENPDDGDDNNNDGDDNNGENPDDEDDDDDDDNGEDQDDDDIIDPNCVIYYTTTDGNIIDDRLLNPWTFGAEIISNTYEDGVGIIKCSTPITTVWSSAFYGYDRLVSITIPDSVTEIEQYAFEYCTNLTNVTIGGNGATGIGYSAFQNCTSLTNVTIGNGVTKIETTAFKDCFSLEHLTIGNGVKTMGRAAFENCLKLTSITIPESMTEIGIYAFSQDYDKEDSQLETVYCKSTTPPSLGYNAFNIDGHLVAPYDRLRNLRVIYVPRESVEAYKEAEEWRRHADIIEPYDF